MEMKEVYSQEEIKAYREKFPKCQHPVNIIYKDGRKSCRCPYDTYGEYGQICKEKDKGECFCLECPYYKERTTPIKDIPYEDEDDYILYAYYQLNKEELERKFGGLK